MSNTETFTGREDGGFDATTRRRLEGVGLTFNPGVFGPKPATWLQLAERPEEQEGAGPAADRVAVLGTHATELAGHICTTKGRAGRKLVLQTILHARRLYQETIVLDEAAIQGSDDFRHGAVTLGVDFMPEVSHARLVFTTGHAVSPLKTWQLGWAGREKGPEAYAGMYMDMREVPLLTGITGNPT